MFVNTIWTFWPNDFLQPVLPEASDCILHFIIAMCSGDVFCGCSGSLSSRSCRGQAFQFYSQCVPRASAHGTQNSHTFNLFAAFAATPPVHVRLHNLHVPIWFPLNHFPSERLNPRINFLRPFHNEGKTHKNQTALSKNTLAAKPNQAMCLFTFPAMAICLRINRLGLRWTVRIQSISWCPHTHTQFSSGSGFLTHTHRSTEIAF